MRSPSIVRLGRHAALLAVAAGAALPAVAAERIGDAGPRAAPSGVQRLSSADVPGSAGVPPASQSVTVRAGRPRSQGAPASLARRPFLSVRGDRVRLEVTAGRPLRSDLFSPTRWGPYLDELAASGYDLLELSTPADGGRAADDLLSRFVAVGGIGGGRPAAERQRDLAGLRKLVALARQRGIGVVLTSSAPAGGTGAGLTRGVRALAAAVPELTAIGLRTGTDRGAARAAIDGIRGAPSFHGALHLEARLTRAAVEELAGRLPGRLVLCIPLDEGQLARPYLPLGDPPRANDPWDAVYEALSGIVLPPNLVPDPSHSTGAPGAPEEHLRLSRPYALLWELGGPPGAAGLPWLDAIFARRAARFCATGDALGFLVASPAGPAATHAPVAQGGDGAGGGPTAYPCWWWHALWGAAGRDPDGADAVVRRRFGERFGVDAGDFIFNSLALLSRMSVAVNAAMAERTALPSPESAPALGVPAMAAAPSPITGPAGAAVVYVMSGEWAWPPLTMLAGSPSSTVSAPTVLPTPAPVDPTRLAMQFVATGELTMPDSSTVELGSAEGAEAEEVERDPRAYASIDAWAEDLLAGRPDGRPGPIERAHELAWFSMRIRGDLDTITFLRPRDAAEWGRLRVALLSGAHLADFYARTLSAAYYWRLYRWTGDEMARTIAGAHEAGARDAGLAFWSAAGGRRPVLAGSGSSPAERTELCAARATEAGKTATTDPHFAKSVSLPAKSAGTPGGSAATADLQPDAATEPPVQPAPPVRAAAEKPPRAPREPMAEPEHTLAIRHIPAMRGTPTRALRIDATIIHGDRPTQVLLRYWLPGATDASELPMTVNFGTARFYAATVPGEGLAEGVLRYRIEAREGDQVCDWPATDAEATWSVPISSDTDGPQLQARHRMTREGGVLVEATATDPAGVERVLLHWRPLDGRSPWHAVTMGLENGVYTAQLPLPAMGLAYSVEAHDRWGNARCFPEPRRETPYVLVTGADRPSPGAHAATDSSNAGSRSSSGSG